MKSVTSLSSSVLNWCTAVAARPTRTVLTVLCRQIILNRSPPPPAFYLSSSPCNVSLLPRAKSRPLQTHTLQSLIQFTEKHHKLHAARKSKLISVTLFLHQTNKSQQRLLTLHFLRLFFLPLHEHKAVQNLFSAFQAQSSRTLSASPPNILPHLML